MLMVMEEVRHAAGNDLAVLVKTNMQDGFKGGIELEESIEIAKILEQAGADALVLSGGFVSKAPMFVMRGAMPVKILVYYIREPLIKFFIKIFGKILIREVPFSESYFLEDALKFRSAVNLPLVYVGGLIAREKIDEVLSRGFELVAFARALIKDPDFIKKLQHNELSRSTCDICNYCIAVMYTNQAVCIQNIEDLNPEIKKMLQ
jgi:2,4-dienoyl-CoA reductase-like NADH-dependent reductase (Old Yellow Enzyme family)